MSKIAVLVPRETMLNQAKNVIAKEGYDIDIVRQVETSKAVYEARKAVEDGAGIIVARGGQASYIKEYTNIPIAEIKMTGQELALLISQAKKIVDKECPRIALIGFENMYSDTTFYDEIYNIRLRKYFIKRMNETAEMVKQAVLDGADIILGGDLTNEEARRYQVPTLFYESTEESIRIAIQTAKKMQFAVEAEQDYNAEMETVLDTSINGIIKINRHGIITNVNKKFEMLINETGESLNSKKLTDVVTEINDDIVNEILSGSRDIYSASVRVKRVTMIATIVPILKETEVRGAVLSCYRFKKKSESVNPRSTVSHRNLQGYITNFKFSDFKRPSKELKKSIELAQVYAYCDNPILIYAEEGTEKEKLAQAIHNNSVYKGGPFVTINCSGLSEEAQIELLFGDPDSRDEDKRKGALALGNYGTVLIQEVEKLTLSSQYRLFRTIRYTVTLQSNLGQTLNLDNRLIFTTSSDLAVHVKNKSFREDLYYLIKPLMLRIPPLRERTHDIEHYVNIFKERFTEKYTRYLRISDEAMQVMKDYSWPGNITQLEGFCTRLFLTTPKKTIREDYVRCLLDELYPHIENKNGKEKEIIYKSPEAVRIEELLNKHHGNRAAVAKEMGISTTTLWRHIKKYEVNKNN